MVKKTSSNTTKARAKKAPLKKRASKYSAWLPGVREPSTLNDAKNAILIVSLGLNLAIFIGWLALQFTTRYDQQVFNLLFVR